MKVLIACEWSGVVRDAFIKKGHDAVSCDLLPTEKPGNHYQGDVRILLKEHWDMIIAFPPCTYILNSGAKHLYIGGKKVNGRDEKRWKQMRAGARFFKLFVKHPCKKKAIENPIMVGHAKNLIGCGEQSQTIQPWMFGHGETKATCLWLYGLPLLEPTKIVKGREPRIHFMSPGPNRSKDRGRTLQGIADAMAEQWG